MLNNAFCTNGQSKMGELIQIANAHAHTPVYKIHIIHGHHEDETQQN